jgi:hypothetical protein
MIIYLKNHEIDREQWDNCIRNSSNVKPYPYSWFLDIMSPGWEALIDDDYDSVFPIPSQKRFFFRIISTPFFLQQLGAYSPDKPAENVIYEFLQYLPDFYRYLDLHISQKISSDGIKVTEKLNYVLDLSKPYIRLVENYSSDCRRKIESAEKKGIEMSDDIKPQELLDLFILNNGKSCKGVLPGDYERIKKLMDFCLINKKGRIIGVRGGRRKLIYGLFIIELPVSKTILFDANTAQSREKRVGYFVVNSIIKKYSSSRSTLDFAGSMMAETIPFVESFGAVKEPYYKIQRNRLLWPVRRIN